MSLDAKKIRSIMEGVDFHGGGAAGAIWAIGEFMKEIAVPAPRFIEGWDLDGPRGDGKCVCQKSVAVSEIIEIQQVAPIGRKQTTLIKTVSGSRLDMDMPYQTFKNEYPELFQ